jgi:5'-nucleotidase
VDEAFFLGGLPKQEILAAFRPHIFFDDHKYHCDAASTVVPTARVPSKVRPGKTDRAA